MKITIFALVILLTWSTLSVNAHFILAYPASRGFNDDAEPNAPCGSFNVPSTNRSLFPIASGFVDIDSFHPSSTLTINIATGNNPSSADFTSADAHPASTISINHPGHSCLQFNLTGFPGVVNNTNATIQLIYNGGDGALHQCVDVILVTSAPGFDSTQCINDNGGTNTTSNGNTNSPSGNYLTISSWMTGILWVSIAIVSMI